ncbi:MAG: hypothetical protein WBB07_21505 [Mycobacterium sp.]
MKRPNEVDLAWDLVDDHRAQLTEAEREMAFVNLGAAEYTVVIRNVLTAVRRAGVPLAAAQVDKVAGWIDFYREQTEFGSLLD